jgi:hypothetical protein
VRNIEEVALYAVLLREAARNRHTSLDAICDDSACEQSDSLSFASLLAADHFTDLDWQLVGVLVDRPSDARELARVLYTEHEQTLEAEALLHAANKKSSAIWAAPIRERWPQVRDSIRAYDREQLATSFAEVAQIAQDTWRKETGQTSEEYWEAWLAGDLDLPEDIRVGRRRMRLRDPFGIRAAAARQGED